MTEIWVDSINGTNQGHGGKEDPVLSIVYALSLLSGGNDKLWVRGVFKDGLKLSGLAPEGLVIDGQNDTLFFGFEGVPGNFDPLSYPARTWGSISISDCHNITLKNMEVWGGIMQSLELNDSHPEVGLKRITLDNITVRHQHQRGIFMGGHNIQDIIIKNCKVLDSVFDGPETHGIYLSGGHWRPDYGVKDIQIMNTTVAYAFGRHGFQFNGRCIGLKVEGCTFFHNEMAGISLIGVQKALIRNNTVYGNNRQGIVIYDYDHNVDCRTANRDITISNNTVVVGPKQWKRDAWHNNTPDTMPAVAVNCNLGKYGKGLMPKNIVIENNLFRLPSDRVLAFSYEWDAKATTCRGNLIWCGPDTMPHVYAPTGVYDMPWLDKNAPKYYHDNVYEAPKFAKSPTYDFVDLSNGPFDFRYHNTDANLYSSVAATLGVGAKIPHPSIEVLNNNVMSERATGKQVGPWWEK